MPLAAKLSLFAAVAASAVAFAAWRWWSMEAPRPTYRRSLSDTELVWKCEDNHTFTAAGQVEPRDCAQCDKPAYPITQYGCAQHGTFEVAVRFSLDADGASYVSQTRVEKGAWTSADEPPRCPRCGQPMTRKPEPIRAKKKPGG